MITSALPACSDGMALSKSEVMILHSIFMRPHRSFSISGSKPPTLPSELVRFQGS